MENYLVIVLRVFILYFLLLFIFRLMGKREIGELSVLDLVVFIMMGEMAVIAIEQHEDPLMHTVIPIITLMIIQLGLAVISLKSRKFRRMIDGKPSLIINKGKIDEREMKKIRYNFDDLLMQLRQKDISNIADVEFAILEPSGNLSVIKKDKKTKTGSYTVPIILNGEVQPEHLKDLNKNEDWLKKELKQRGHKDFKKISFCSYQDGKFFIDYDDLK